MQDLLNKYLTLSPDRLHPLPWSEPFCAPLPALGNVTLLQKVGRTGPAGTCSWTRWPRSWPSRASTLPRACTYS